MKIVLFTSNALRHKYFANTLGLGVEEALAVVEVRPHDGLSGGEAGAPLEIQAHWRERYEAERRAFPGEDTFRIPTLPLMRGEASLPAVCDVVRIFRPDAMFVFGSSLLKEPLLSLLPGVPFVNLHLGLSPYYRGSGTNFWPFVKGELHYLGSTLLHIDPGVDTGDIIAHVRPALLPGDDVHTAGCRVIRSSVDALRGILGLIREGRPLTRVPQWKVEDARYFRNADFNIEALRAYRHNLAQGLVDKFLKASAPEIRLIS